MKFSLLNIATIFFISCLLPMSAKAQNSPFPAKTITTEDFILDYQCITSIFRKETRGEILVRSKNPFDYRITGITMIRIFSPSTKKDVRTLALGSVGSVKGTFISDRIEKIFTFSGSLTAERYVFGIRQAKGIVPIPIRSVACQTVRTGY